MVCGVVCGVLRVGGYGGGGGGVEGRRCCGFRKVEGRWGLGDRGLGGAWECAVGGFGRWDGVLWEAVALSVDKVAKRKRRSL